MSFQLSVNKRCLSVPDATSLHLLFSFTSKWFFCYIYVCVQKKIVIERTRDLIYLKFVATDFFPKIICPSTGENSGDLA